MGKYNRYPNGKSGSLGLSVFIIFVALAVSVGYVGAKYGIGPLFLEGKTAEKEKQVAENPPEGQKVVDGLTVTGEGTADQGGTDNTGGQPADTNNGGTTGTDSGTAPEIGTTPPSNPLTVIDDQQEIKDVDQGAPAENVGAEAPVMGKGPFSVQFGSFSTKESAEKLCTELSTKGIYAYAYESHGSHKVLGLPYADKEKAKEAAAVVSATVTDVFVVDISALL